MVKLLQRYKVTLFIFIFFYLLSLENSAAEHRWCACVFVCFAALELPLLQPLVMQLEAPVDGGRSPERRNRLSSQSHGNHEKLASSKGHGNESF